MTTIAIGNAVHPANLPPPDYADDQLGQGAGNPGAGYTTTYVNYSNGTASSAESSRYEGDYKYTTFSDKKIRHAFIRKVYFILLIQLAVTVGIICLFLFCEPVKEWVQANSWAYWISYAVFVVTYITLACCPSVRMRVPGNYICLVIFTLAMSYMAATISSYYDTTMVLIGIGVTAGMCLGITLFAVQTKIDFTLGSGFILTLCLVIVYSGGTCLVLWLCGYTLLINCFYGGLIALVFSWFLVFDTQRVVGGKDRAYELSPEDYICGALELYLDIVYLLLIIIACSSR